MDGMTDVGKTMIPEVVIYGSDRCHWRKVAKDFFEVRKIPYEYKDVSNPDVYKELKEVAPGAEGIPVITIGDFYTVGANEKKLEAMLKAVQSGAYKAHEEG